MSESPTPGQIQTYILLRDCTIKGVAYNKSYWHKKLPDFYVKSLQETRPRNWGEHGHSDEQKIRGAAFVARCMAAKLMTRDAAAQLYCDYINKVSEGYNEVPGIKRSTLLRWHYRAFRNHKRVIKAVEQTMKSKKSIKQQVQYIKDFLAWQPVLTDATKIDAKEPTED